VGALKQQGIEAVLAAGGSDGNADLSLQHLPVPGEFLSSESKRRLTAAIGAADLVEIHSLWNGTSSAAASACRRAGVPYILTPRGMLDPECVANRAASKRLYRLLVDESNIAKANGFHFLSPDERDRALVGRKLSENEIAISPNGAMEPPDAVPAGVLRELFPQTKGRPVLLHLGRLDPIKRIELQIRALARMPEDSRPVLLLVGPDYGERRRLEQIVQDEHVQESVIFGGSINDERRFSLLAEADLVLLTSTYDCNPVVATETFMMGGAMLATNSCGLSAPAAAGAVMLVRGNVDEVATGVQSLLVNPEKLRALRRQGKEYAAHSLSWKTVIRPLIDLYERVATARSSALEHEFEGSSFAALKS